MKEADMPIPHLFRCPISLDLFTDPVTLCTGQTYDRSSIEKWLSAGNQTCPVTMQKLQDPSMVPNHTLRHLIDHWLQIRRHSDPSRRQTATGPESPDPSAAAALKHCLVSHHSTLENKLQTVETIRVLSDELPSRNSCLIQLDFFPLLLGLVFSEISRENLMFVEKALVCALKLLPFCSLRPLNMLKEESKMDFFLELFNHSSSVTIKKSLCQFVEAISSSLETKELAVILGTNQTLGKGIVLLLQINSGATEFGIRAISALCSHESNRRNLVTEGAVDGLIAYIVAGERQEIRNLAATAVAALELLLGVEGAKEAVIRHPSGFDALVKMVFRVSDHGGSESAVNSLAIVCSDSVEARGGAIRAGVLTQLLLLLQSQCGGRTKTKARMLLKLLRSTWAEDSTYV